MTPTPPRRPFTLVFAGGGARGYAHVGVLRGLEHLGLAPAGIVGVSMGAIAGFTYAAREDWYEALLSLDASGAPPPARPKASGARKSPAVRRALKQARTAWSLMKGWGAPEDVAEAGRAGLESLVGSLRLEQGRIPVTVCATDLLSGDRVELDAGPAVPALLASSALAGVFPPVAMGPWILADGVYADIAPIDVARAIGAPVVIAVDPTQDVGPDSIGNGLQAVMRGMEICYLTHAKMRIARADLVLRPVFGRFVDTLDFGARRVCVSAGIRAVRAAKRDIERVLSPG